MTLLKLDNQIVNTEHIVKAEYTPHYAGGEVDDDYDDGRLTPSRPARLVITLTALELQTYSEGYNELHLAAASKSQEVTVRGMLAVIAWDWFANKAQIPGEPWTDDDAREMKRVCPCGHYYEDHDTACSKCDCEVFDQSREVLWPEDD